MPEGFLRSWVSTHVVWVPLAERAEHVEKWAVHCVADAITAGIPYGELLKAAGGSVPAYIQKAADAASAGSDNA